MDLFGVNVSMADFVGRQGAARAEPARAEQDRTPVAGR
jgi:hypothetical protein